MSFYCKIRYRYFLPLCMVAKLNFLLNVVSCIRVCVFTKDFRSMQCSVWIDESGVAAALWFHVVCASTRVCAVVLLFIMASCLPPPHNRMDVQFVGVRIGGVGCVQCVCRCVVEWSSDMACFPLKFASISYMLPFISLRHGLPIVQYYIILATSTPLPLYHITCRHLQSIIARTQSRKGRAALSIRSHCRWQWWRDLQWTKSNFGAEKFNSDKVATTTAE